MEWICKERFRLCVERIDRDRTLTEDVCENGTLRLMSEKMKPDEVHDKPRAANETQINPITRLALVIAQSPPAACSSAKTCLNRDFLFDFPIPTRLIVRRAFLCKVLADFGPQCSRECSERPVSRLAGSRRLKMLFSPSILATLLSASPASSSKIPPLRTSPYPAGDGSSAIFASMPANSRRVR